jgi:hypothetical protein
MDLQPTDKRNAISAIASTEDVRKFQFMPLRRRLFKVFIIASLPLTAVPSLAHTFPYDPSAPSFLKTPTTGTGFGVPAKNQTFLCSSFAGFNTTGISITKPDTPWVDGQKVIPAQIPYVEGEVDWSPVFNTWVENGVRYFTGNGLPNHPTGQFPLTTGQDAYPYYAALPDPYGEYANAAELPMAAYNLYMSVPANPIYSENPTCLSDLTIAISTQTGPVFDANIAVSSDPLYVDPIADLPLDSCWGHPIQLRYHYHGYSWKCFPDQGDVNQHSPIMGIALDGFGVFGPRGDGGVLLTNENLDVCHGHSGKIDWDGILNDMYHYHLNNEFPYGPGCFRGTKIGVFSTSGDPSASTAAVPGPVPLLGVMAAFRYSRRLRKRFRLQATGKE